MVYPGFRNCRSKQFHRKNPHEGKTELHTALHKLKDIHDTQIHKEFINLAVPIERLMSKLTYTLPYITYIDALVW